MNNGKKLTQAEADRMLNMIKCSLVKNINFPSKGSSLEFDLVGESQKEIFTTKIYRGRINHLKYELGARIKKMEFYY